MSGTASCKARVMFRVEGVAIERLKKILEGLRRTIRQRAPTPLVRAILVQEGSMLPCRGGTGRCRLVSNYPVIVSRLGGFHPFGQATRMRLSACSSEPTDVCVTTLDRSVGSYWRKAGPVLRQQSLVKMQVLASTMSIEASFSSLGTVRPLLPASEKAICRHTSEPSTYIGKNVAGVGGSTISVEVTSHDQTTQDSPIHTLTSGRVHH